jgi:hypothetical protein
MNNNIYYNSPSLSSILSDNEPEINEILQLNENNQFNINNENYNKDKLKEKIISKKFQLFQEIPDLEFVLKIINCFNLKDLNDKKKIYKKKFS